MGIPSAWTAALLTALSTLAPPFASGAGHEAATPLAQRLAHPDRPAADRARDADRRPAQVVAFLGVEPGMTAIDLVAFGGYYTEVLSLAVGPEGRVYAQNSPYVLKLRDGVADKEISARLAGDRLPNVERLDRDLKDAGIAPGSVDVAVTALNFHDIYNGRGPEAAAAFLAAVFGLLEPGGLLGLIDHAGNPGADNEKLHRIDEALVTAAVRSAGFEIEATSDILRNPDDDRSKSVFDPEIRGRTDRFVMRLRKPR